MDIKPLNFASYPGYEEPTFHLGMYSIPKASVYISLGIPFSNDLSLEPIITYMNTKVRKSLFSFSSFLSNNKVPLIFKRSIIQSYIISKALYFAPLLGSNKNNSKNVQSLINTALLWVLILTPRTRKIILTLKRRKNLKIILKGTQRLVFMPYFVIFKYFQLLAFVLLFI